MAVVPAAVREQLQFLCSRLDHHDQGVPSSIAVTSALSGEGVTFISRALAGVLSEDVGRRTCLVSANWWSTDATQSTDGDGLAGVIRDDRPVEDVLIKTKSDCLSLIESGSLPEVERMALSTTRAMSVVMAELRPLFDHVVIDLPATSTSTAAMNFAAAADASLLVARQQMVRADQVQVAASDLQHTRLLGVVLNDFHLSMPKAVQRRLIDA